ncbi:MAG: ABC transporter permease [Gemmataceae bacterium]
MKLLVRLLRAIVSLLGTLLVLGLSLLPLSALLVALPFLLPNEAILSDSVKTATSFPRRLARRVLGLFAGVMVLVSLVAFATEAVTWLPLPTKGQLGPLAEKVLGYSVIDFMPEQVRTAVDGKTPLSDVDLYNKYLVAKKTMDMPGMDSTKIEKAREDYAEFKKTIDERIPESPRLKVLADSELSKWLAVPLWKLLPSAMVQHWPFVFLIVYAFDLLLLMVIGKVPLAYNVRNLIVRYRIAGLTAFAFTVVVALLIVLLAFVNGMYKLNQSTGIPGNVFILSDGATDELFSNLGYGDVDNIFRVAVDYDEKGFPIKDPIRVKRAVPEGNGNSLRELNPGEVLPKGVEPVFLASKELYFVVNQPIPPKPGLPPRRRFLQTRAIQDPLIAAKVHNVDLLPGGQWFSRAGVQGSEKPLIQCVLGEGAASVLGEDANKPMLEPGDQFVLGDRDWIVVGVMKAEGTTFGSEVWVPNIDLVTGTFGKKGNYTTVVARTEQETAEAARAFAYHLQNRYTLQKLKAFSEPDYYMELTKTNDTFLVYIIAVAVIMAIGGVFGVMNTMFASIAARIKEVGVLRILGFKRWQILISFMLESLLIALIGGILGCMIGYVANGYEAKSTIGGAGGGGKNVSLKMLVDYQTVAAGILFTLIMGRLGGLVPALSAMRMKILDSLK